MSVSTLTFAGGAGSPTGAMHLVRHDALTLLLDCGLHRGSLELRLRNWAEPYFEPHDVDAVILTQADVDHAGYLPLLVRAGFTGRVYCTHATAAMLASTLRSAARLQDEECERARQRGVAASRPLFTEAEVERCLHLVEGHAFGVPVRLPDGASTFTLYRAGGIVGAAMIMLDLPGESPLRLTYTGALGALGTLSVHAPAAIMHTDVLVLDGAGGDLASDDARGQLFELVGAAPRPSQVMVLAPSVLGATLELLWELSALRRTRVVPDFTILLDGYGARELLELHDDQTVDHGGDARVAPAPEHAPRVDRDFQLVDHDVDAPPTAGVTIYLACGAAWSGPTLAYLARALADASARLVVLGRHPPGTIGRELADGAPRVVVDGEEVHVKATVVALHGLSTRAERVDIMRWLGAFVLPPRQCWVTLAEPRAATQLSEIIGRELGWSVAVAEHRATIPLRV